MKDRTSILFILILISVFGNIDLSAQTKDTVSTDKFIENFNKNSLLEHREKLFIHMDRTVFLPGEELWFKAYLVTATDLQSDTLENILYFELKNEDDTVLVKRSYKVYTGRVNGVFYLPDSINTGVYKVSAYTNWMLNDFGGTPYSANIYIYNGQPAADNDSKDTNRTSVPETGKSQTGPQKITPAKTGIDLKFYPEGGALVPELKTLVAFEASDSDGEPISVEGEIKDDEGNFVTFFKTFKRGRGFFWLQPEPGRKYTAVLKSSDDSEIKVDLPETEKYGYILNVNNPFSEDSVIVDIKARYPGVNNNFYLLGIQEKLVAMAIRGNASKKSYRIKIAKSTFKTGIVTFSLLDANMIPQRERKIFINHYDTLRISLNVDKKDPGKREPIELSVNVRDKAGKPVSGDFSLSVIDASHISGSMQKEQNISSYLLLSSDLPGLKEDAGPLLLKNEDAHSLLDLIMLTNGWQKFVWEKIPDDYKLNPEHELEKQNWLNGHIYKKDDPEKTGANFSISAFLFGEFNDFYKTQTDDNGNFKLIFLDFFDTTRIQIRQTNKMGYDVTKYTMDLESNLTLLKDSDSGPYNNSFISLNRDYISKPEEETPPVMPDTLPMIRSLKMSPDIYGSELDDFKADSTTIMINEVEIPGKKPKTPQEKITAVYGAPSTVIGSEQIEALRLKHPWRHNLFDIIMDAIPGLSIDVNKQAVDNWYYRVDHGKLNYDQTGAIKQLGPIGDLPMTFGFYGMPTGLINFKLKDANGRLIYIFVDGEYIASTNVRGWLRDMKIPYEIPDLIDVNISNIKSVELILNIKDNPDKNILDNYIDLRKDNPVILAIYTKDGRGLLSWDTEKKIANLKILGFVREREFHSPDYSEGEKYSSALDDRKTLLWAPEVKLDSSGNAKIRFYNSDIATSLHIEMNGISAEGNPGHTLLTIGEAKTGQTDANNAVDQNIITSPLIFNENIWNNYLNELKKNDLTPCIALDTEGKPIPYADIFIKNANIETTANASGIFAFDDKAVKDDDLILISDAGKRYLSIPVMDVVKNNGIIKVPDVKINKEKLKANNQLISEILKANKRPNNKLLALKAIYREKIEKDKYIFSLTDYTVDVLMLRNFSNDMPHITNIENGRVFKATNYSKAIDFKPIRPISNDVIQLTDPVLDDDLYFIREYYKKYLDIKLEGSLPFRGEDVYKISFKQKDNNAYNLYDGFMLVRKDDLKILYIYRTSSEVARKFQTGSYYLENTGNFDLSKVRLLNNEFINSYRKAGNIYVPKFMYSSVDLKKGSEQISYSRELESYGSVSEDAKKQPAENLKKKTMLIKNVKYAPYLWRNSMFMLPDLKMFEQAKFLNEVTIY